MVFAVRFILAGVIAVVLMHLFRPNLHIGWSVLLAGFLMVIVYVRGRFDTNNNKPDKPT